MYINGMGEACAQKRTIKGLMNFFFYKQTIEDRMLEMIKPIILCCTSSQTQILRNSYVILWLKQSTCIFYDCCRILTFEVNIWILRRVMLTKQ